MNPDSNPTTQPDQPATPKTPVQAVPQPIEQTTTGLSLKSKSVKKRFLLIGLGLLLTLIIAFVGAFLYYQQQLSAVDQKNTEKIVVTIKEGSTPSVIGSLLKEKGLIRSDAAFGLYTRLNGTQNNLQAGAYRLSPSESTPEIVAHLLSGKVDTFNITFLPGATLAQNREVLLKAGYTATEVDAGLSATYESPLFESKPAASDFEGYIYGETYKFGSDATVEDVLNYVFQVYATVLEKNNLAAQFKTQGLTVYEGITLASIIQRESIGGDEPQIASVFYNRKVAGMPLGSDVTYQYAADKAGVARDTELNSPYNTRVVVGLPPGPIAAPGLNALKAVAAPAKTDYLFFLSGDDDITYYGRTLSEHESNIKAHCQAKCQII